MLDQPSARLRWTGASGNYGEAGALDQFGPAPSRLRALGRLLLGAADRRTFHMHLPGVRPEGH